MCLTKRLTKPPSPAGTGRHPLDGAAREVPAQDTGWTDRHPLDGVLIAHNPKVAGSNPAPATDVMSRDIGKARTRIRVGTVRRCV